jgi:hypothetical protein
MYVSSYLLTVSQFAVLNVTFFRSLTARLAKSKSPIIVTALNPGLCFSELTRNVTGEKAKRIEAEKAEFAYTTEEGSRHILYAALKGLGSKEEEDKVRGEYSSRSHVQDVSDFVLSEEGKRFADKVWVSAELRLVLHADLAVGRRG